MKNTPQYWHNNKAAFIVTLLIISYILTAALYFYSFSYVFAWEIFQQLTATLLVDIGFMVKLSATMAVITYPSAIINGIGMFIAEDSLSFGVPEMSIMALIISVIIGMTTTWLFFTLSIKKMLLISAIFGVMNVMILIILFSTLVWWDEVTKTTLDNWYFRLFGKSLPLTNIGIVQRKKLTTWLNLNTKKWCICEDTKKIYVIGKADYISLKLTFYEKNSKLES